ncbi:MAG: UDP-3-O-(3-hydroxymyristoyl)glucosamine N-acyltransferase [Calditrichota bacterium]|jgi:UDP-3-O-[3-hydroxymyristoyl] glucosamine N-acyltransferase
MVQKSVSELAKLVRGEVIGDNDIQISGAAKLDIASPGEITFLANLKYKNQALETRASAIVIGKNVDFHREITQIRVDDAYYRFLEIFLVFNPPSELIKPGIHPTATLGQDTKIGDSVAIGQNVVIGQNCQIGNNTKIHANCVILDNVSIGENCFIYPLVSIRESCRIGNRVVIHNGAVIGSDGFGFAPFEGIFHKIPQVGIVIIEDDVEIGANCTIDRATMDATIIRKGAKLDNLVHIAHNVEIGESTVIAAQTGISGSTKIGHHVMIGGQVGTVGHIQVGDYAQIGAQSGVSKNIPEKEIFFGYPARPIMRTKRIEAVINQLPELYKKINQLEKELKAHGSKK